MLRSTILVGLMMMALLGTSSAGHAQVSVNIGINPPAPPSLVIIPGTPVAYAPAAPANYFFYGGQYYVFVNGAWYVGYTYNGPWIAIAPAYVPAPLLRVPVRYYRTPPPHWKQWQRAAPPRWEPGWGHEWAKEHKEDEKEWRRAEREDDKERKHDEKRDRKGHKK